MLGKLFRAIESYSIIDILHQVKGKYKFKQKSRTNL